MKRNRSRVLLLAALTLFLSTRFLSPSPGFCAQELPAGKIIEKVVCRTDGNQSYALFIPTNYTPNKKWPILYGFDPGARGVMPVELFKEAAEKYGYIVVGSNNSRNGPFEISVAAMRAMWDDTHARFSIDDKRIYTTGFSGGARVACRVGYMLEGYVAGVIASGGGFPYDISPSRSTPFVFFGIAGTADFNFVEMRRINTALDGYGIANRLAVFEGEHSWPPKELCAEAIEWMEIQAIKTGRREKNDALTGDIFARRVERARQHEASDQLYDAYASYDAIAQDFKGLKDVTEFENKAALLKSSEQVKQYRKQEKQQEERQQTRTREFFALKETLKDPENRARAFADLKDKVSDLKKRAADKQASTDQIIARRLLGLFFVQAVEESRGLIERKQYEMAAISLAIASEIRPENARVLYNLACVYALGGEKKLALKTLEKAVEKGVANVSEIESNKDFDSLRTQSDYKRLIDSLKNKD